MPIEQFTIERATGDLDYQELTQDLSSPGATSAMRCIGEIALQLSGTATSVTGVLQRSTRDPNASPNWAPAGDAITGNPSTGIQVKRYDEPTRAWYRFNCTALVGGTVTVVFSGEKA